MIRSAAEHRRAQRDLALATELMEEERRHWLGEGMTEGEAHRMLEPIRLRVAELRDRLELYDRVRAGDLSMFTTLEDAGRALIAARVAKGLSQRDFAKLVGVHESQVCRDEQNEYHGIGVERLMELMEKVGMEFSGLFRLGEGVEVERPV